MGRSIVSNLKFKKTAGNFNPQEFAKLLDEAYLSTKRPEQVTTKTSFSPSTLGYGYGNCPRYWYLAFSGVIFVDDNDAIAVANMAQGTQAHERIQGLINKIMVNKSDEQSDNGTLGLDILTPQKILKEEEKEIKNIYPPIRGFIDLVLDWNGETVLGEIKTAKQEIWDSRQAEMQPSPNHLLQLLTYMKLMETKEGFFLYENKNTQEVLIIPIQMNERNKEIIDGLFTWMCEVWDNFKDGDLPMRPFTKSSSSCKYCPIKKECWSRETGTVQIEAYEVPKL
jgi:CRISPR/Cas system-associated exonuclease Cas4 (RecB family)